MKQRIVYAKLPFSGLQILGCLMMLSGLVLLFGSGVSIWRLLHQDPHDALAEHQEELKAGISPDIIESEILINYRLQAAAKLPQLFLSGLLVIGSVPLFYAPYADGLELWRRPRKVKAETEEPESLVDEQFIYPDDDFDFIIDKNIRAKLIREKRRRLRKQKRK